MSTPDKCPHCGADSVGNHGEGWFSCGSHRSHKEPSPLCRKRTAHEEMRKRADLFENQLKHAISQRDFWEQRCDEKDAEIKREREKWEKLRAWAGANFHFDEDPLLEMNRLDAEAKGGR